MQLPNPPTPPEKKQKTEQNSFISEISQSTIL